MRSPPFANSAKGRPPGREKGARCASFLFCVGQGVGEVVGVFAVFDDDIHGALEAGELVGGGVGDYDYVEVEDAGLHGAVVLEDEGAGATVEGTGDTFDGYVAAGAFHGASAGEHFAFAGGFEGAVELLVDGVAADGVVFGFEGGVEGGEFYFEGAGGVMGGHVFLLGGAESKDGEWEKEEQRGAGFGFHGFLVWCGIGRRNIA